MRSAKAGPVTAIIAAATAENTRAATGNGELVDLFSETIDVGFAMTTACCLPVEARAATVLLLVDAHVEATVERMVIDWRERGREERGGKRFDSRERSERVCGQTRKEALMFFLNLLCFFLSL